MIYLTGASGYLGQHIMALDPTVQPVLRGQEEMVRGQVVIHAAWPTPRSEAEAHDIPLQQQGLTYTVELMRHQPRFVVFVGTRADPSPYTVFKFGAARLCDPCHVVQFPGLYGAPRKGGLMYRMFHAALNGEAFQPDRPLPAWTGMRVDLAAGDCLWAAVEEKPGTTVCQDPDFEEWLEFCR